jgi:hypothetical protein
MQASILEYMIEVDVHTELLARDLAWARSVDPLGPFLRSTYVNAVVRLGALFVRWGNYLQHLNQPLSRSIGD